MNVQAHHSGQIAGELPSQASTMVPGQSQLNGNAAPNPMQNPSSHRSILRAEPEIERARSYMLQKISDFVMQRCQQSHEMPYEKMIDIVKRLEEGLFRRATTTEEYLNLSTLDVRLRFLINRHPMRKHNQQFAHANSSPPVGTMIPTPGFQQTGNSSLIGAPSVESSLVSSATTTTSSIVDSGGFLSTTNGSSGRSLASGYQQSLPAFSVNVGGDNALSPMGVPRMTSQMIPTPGIRNSTNDIDGNANKHRVVNLGSLNNASTCRVSESSSVLRPLLHKRHAGDQNNNTSQNIVGLMNDGIRSTLQKQSFRGPLNAGFGMMRNNMHAVSGPTTTEGHSTGAAYGNLTKPLHQHFDQHQQPVISGDGQAIGEVDSSVSGSLYVPVTSSGLILINQSSNTSSVQSMPTTSSPLANNNQTSLYPSVQMTTAKPQSIDQPERMKFQSHYSARKSVQLPQHQQSQQQSQQQSPQFRQRQVVHSLPQLPHSNMVSEMKPAIGPQDCDGVHRSQISGSYHFSDMQNQFNQNSMEDPYRASHLLSNPSGTRDINSSQAGVSGHVQQFLHHQEIATNPPGDFTGLTDCIRPGGASRGHQNSKPQNLHVSVGIGPDQSVQDEFHQRLTEQDAAQQNNLSAEGSVLCQSDTSRSAEPLNSSVPRAMNLERPYRNEQRWLLLLRHAHRCPAPEGKCHEKYCLAVQKLLKHIERCDASQCKYPRCYDTRKLLKHNRQCRHASCPICVPVKNFVQAHLTALACANSNAGLHSSVSGPVSSHEGAQVVERSVSKTGIQEIQGDLQPLAKRMKTEQGPRSLVSERKDAAALLSANDYTLYKKQNAGLYCDSVAPLKSEITEVKTEIPDTDGHLSLINVKMKKGNMDDACGDHTSMTNRSVIGIQEAIKPEKEVRQAKLESPSVPSENASKTGKPKVNGVSMIELFTPEQVRQHILGLRQWVGQSKAKAERNQAMGHSVNENSCQLCAVEKLAFEPPPIYCTSCGVRVKRNAMYYTARVKENCHYFCIPCYNDSRGDTIVLDGSPIQKSNAEKKKNDEVTEEWWVQCDKCEAWQHQICALFNGRRNEGGQAEYTCPNCYIEEVDRGERAPLPQSAVLGAKDLPRTSLSDHLEQRLFAKLIQERQDRASFQGKSYDEVPGAEKLVVRVVSSADKKLDVKPHFLEIFREENYPTDFPYKSKVVLLFQQIEGVDVCLFGMYLQEFGSECLQPNQRRVYLSYLDSVKYFRPDVKAVTGEALRTFVYHEILIGYLDYCKQRGFASCYIWACPPLKGEDYIIYCHPEIQKTPKSDKLREWYLAMLRKALKENIVVELTNLYEHFFVSSGECKAKVTAARLPYFDGDYWPGAAEDFIYQLQMEEDGKKPHKKSFTKKSITKRALKAAGQTDLSGHASKDLLLMRKLGETISPMKEDFIMVHLQHACSHCCILMVSGNHWVCKQCKNFQLCDKCYDAELKREDRERHPINVKDKHTLYPVEIREVPHDTKDDEFLDSEFFDTRQTFLSLCQGNHYQYDTLRRAKHSSMMILYHLHNPSAPAFVMPCSICHLDIEAGCGWHCVTCPDYDVCNACYQKGGVDHPHKIINHQSNDQQAQNKEARQLRVQQAQQHMRKMLDLLIHASRPHSLCQYPNCRKVKGLFRHGMTCKTRAAGGCVLCKKMWYLLQLHSRSCNESECSVPRCSDLRIHVRRQQHQSDSRRRAAVNEMMRQRAAEVAGSSC